MYSILPASVAILFLIFGFYVMLVKGMSAVTATFLALCTTTFFWQFTWAILFQTEDPIKITYLIKIGYFLILLLPTSMYHFMVQVTGNSDELRWVFASYILVLILAVLLVFTNSVIAGHYDYFWGAYPKAGSLLLVHILQSFTVFFRSIYIVYRKQKIVQFTERTKLQHCLAGLIIYMFAAVDYLCNYGFEFYPPGVVFITISLVIIAIGISHYHLMDKPLTLPAAGMVHELRTPLAIIGMSASGIAKYWDQIITGYNAAVKANLIDKKITEDRISLLSRVPQSIQEEVSRSSEIIDIFLATANGQMQQRYPFKRFSVNACVKQVMAKDYLFAEIEHELTDETSDFEIIASDILLNHVMFNLIKNSVQAIKSAGKGKIIFNIDAEEYCIEFMDTGSGISKNVLPHIFDPFFTGKKDGHSSGMGLYFCKLVMDSFEGKIKCESVLGEYTKFKLSFPRPAEKI